MFKANKKNNFKNNNYGQKNSFQYSHNTYQSAFPLQSKSLGLFYNCNTKKISGFSHHSQIDAHLEQRNLLEKSNKNMCKLLNSICYVRTINSMKHQVVFPGVEYSDHILEDFSKIINKKGINALVVREKIDGDYPKTILILAESLNKIVRQFEDYGTHHEPEVEVGTILSA